MKSRSETVDSGCYARCRSEFSSSPYSASFFAEPQYMQYTYLEAPIEAIHDHSLIASDAHGLCPHSNVHSRLITRLFTADTQCTTLS